MKPKFYTLILALLILPWAAMGQAQPQAPGPIVKEIDVQYAGAPATSKQRIIANMRTQVGKPYSEQVVEEDVRNLYATGTVTNVRIFGEQIADGVKVVVVVQGKSSVTEVRIEGVTRLKVEKLRKQLKVKVGSALNESSLEEDRQHILDEYQKRGFTDTGVQYKVEANEALATAHVLYTVNEGGKTSIKAIHFEGNTVFKDRELRKVIKTRTTNLLSFITKSGHLQNEQLDADVISLKEYYQNHGYEDVEISGPSMDRTGSNVALTFDIREGQQYHVTKVDVAGSQVFTGDELRGRLKLQEGAIYSPQAIRADVKSIQDSYGARGYVDLQVTPEVVPAGANQMSVNYRLDEGAQSYVERVNVQGNTRTKDKVIRRELAVTPGDVYNTVRVDASKQRLQNLNYFSRIDVYPSDTMVPGRKDLNVLVEEKKTGSFNFGAGFSSVDNLIGFAEIQQGNFDVTNWPNFTGGGQKFRIRAQYGTKRKDFVIGLTEPWFMDYQIAVGGELFYRDAQFVSNVYSQRNYGIDLNARKSISDFTAVRLDYRLENISIMNVDNGVSQIIRDEEGSRIKSSLTAGITNDTRDSVFLTRKGHRVDLSGYVAGGPLGGNEKIYGFDLEGAQYFSLPWDTIFLINGEIASVNTWSGGDRVPIYDRLYLGGSNNLRGYKFRDISPKDENGEPIGGKSLARITFEYTFPVIERVRGALFYDTGFVNTGSYDFGFNNVSSDVGFGVRLDLPIGPVRIDYGIPVQSGSSNGSGGKFNFNIGYQF